MSEPSGVIHDIGYRHYDGPRHGRAYARTALFTNSLRGAFGLGRPAKSKIMPMLLGVIMLLPATVSIAVMALLREGPLSYTGYAVTMQAVVAIFLATQAPYLVGPDQRYRVLPLLFSRPGTPTDYIVAKVAAIVGAMMIIMVLPITLMFVGEIFVNPPGPLHTGDYLRGVGGAFLFAIFLGTVGIALASLTPRRGLGVASVIAFYLITLATSTVLSGVLESLSHDTASRWTLLINPFMLVDAIQVWIFGSRPALGIDYPSGAGGPVALLAVLLLIGAALAILVNRYRKAASS
ncbi:ABC transporter permease [Rhizohabitans arisaemae]|uniref:ABC transporter permease n=1 Tax=Rhizohabitans arisaemae TaxID=2720610 RepID=UPI0024B0DAE6|nr:ABC transporter permease [Rhizohabitans arisaemae]